MSYYPAPPQPPVLHQVIASSTLELSETTSPISWSKEPISLHKSDFPQVTLALEASALGSPQSVGKTAPVAVKVTRIIAQERGGDTQEFELTIPVPDSPAPNENSPPIIEESLDLVEVKADQQQYDQQQQVISAQGNVEIRFDRAVLTADRLRVNLPDRLAVAEGNVVLRRGDQVLRGERFEYFFFQDNGTIENASGEVYLPTVSRDTAATLPTASGDELVPEQPLSDRLAAAQPLQRVATDEGYRFVLGSTRNLALLGEGEVGLPSVRGGGRINRLRFQAEKVDFEANTWQATDVRITNDPFSPPELELRADTATFRNVAPLVDEVVTTNSRVVFDDRLAVPTFQNRLVLDRRPRQPGLFQIGYDGEERGGLYLERSFNLVDTERVVWKVSPQYYLQRAIAPGILNQEDEGGNVIGSSAFGVETELGVAFSPRTTLAVSSTLTSLEPDELEDELKANLRLQQKIGELENPYDLSFEANYRRRLFNGSLGFQRVQSSFGVLLESPVIPVADTGVDLSYQVGIQNINAETDREEFLSEDDDDETVTNLTRYQGAVALSKDFLLWQGEALAPTAEAGLRYTGTPVLPFLQLTTGVTGVFSYYSNGDTQPSLIGSIGLRGQIGHFSRPYLDYTGFNVRYSQGIRGDASPFKFDRFVDQSTIAFGITQQIYGPFRLGFQTSFSLDENDDISTDYFLEYSRRTYNVRLRYNPVLEIGSVSFQVNDFNWIGDPEPFGGTNIQPVNRGITR